MVSFYVLVTRLIMSNLRMDQQFVYKDRSNLATMGSFISKKNSNVFKFVVMEKCMDN